MKLTTIIDKLCCPFDKDELELKVITRDLEGQILEGVLLCIHCKRIYPIIKGIPIMSPDEYREYELEEPLLKKWELHLEGKEIKDFKLIER